ncbi:MAG: cyclic nucleotide-binding domain-containing protein, partial [SAR324 cluster bacterium]|nr:cyclic nucleotide-binding domain-containing protein [SAR324 cluster bacterium]
KNIQVFSGISDEMLGEMAIRFEELKVYSEEVLIRNGDTMTNLFLVLSGQIGIYGQEKCLEVLDRGAYVGQLAILAPHESKITMIAHEDSELLTLNAVAFLDFANEYVEVGLNIITILCECIQGSRKIMKTF